MSPEVIVALIAAGGSILAALIGLIGILIQMRRGIKKLLVQTDGLMTKMETAARAEGVETGHAAGVASGVIAGANGSDG